MKFQFSILFLCLLLGQLQAQIGGNSTYEFLRLPTTARITGLGGSLITVRDADLGLAYSNPAALNESMHQKIAFNQSIYMGATTYGYLAYGHHLDKIPLTLHGGLKYMSYGRFEDRDAAGLLVGESRAAEYSFHVGAGYQMSEFLSVGANMKTILSYLGPYNSTGMAFDLSAMYNDTSKKVALTIAFKNMGTQFSTYARNQNFEPLPFDLQIGFAHRLKYIPLRFSVIMHNLHQWGIVYDDPAQQNSQILLTDNSQQDNSAGKVVDDIFRHMIFNLEFLFGKKGKPETVRLAVGYNHMRRGELGISTLNNLSGFSFGLGIRVKQFQFDYGFGSYHFAGAAHHLGLSVSLSEFMKGGSRKKSKVKSPG
jgi:hypothetical protein